MEDKIIISYSLDNVDINVGTVPETVNISIVERIGEKGDPGIGIPVGGSIGQVLSKNSTTDYDIVWSSAGAGDMTKSVYDANDNGIVDKATGDKNGNDITTTYSNVSHNHTGIYQPVGTYSTDIHGNIIALNAVSGVNTGDETQLTIKTKLGAATTSVDGYATSTQITKLDGIATGANIGVIPNTAITGATKTKITYDSKGLVTSGTDATTADIADSTDKRYQTDNQKLYNDATSSIQTQLNAKLPSASVINNLTTPSTSSALSANQGKILNDIKRDKTEQGDAHGFINPPNASNFTLANTGASVTFGLLSNAGNYKINGTDYTNNGSSFTFTASLGQNFIYLTSSGLASAASTWDILDITKIPVATVNYDGTNVRLGDELHRSNRNLMEHKKQHDTDGARYVSGFGLVSAFGAGAANTFSFASGTIRDEERYHDIAAKTNCQIAYRNAAQNAMIFESASSRYAKVSGVTTGTPYYDNAGTLTALGNNNYGVMFMFATNGKLPTDSEIVSVMGQGTYANVAAAQAASLPTLSGMSVAEWKLLYRVIIRQVSGALVFIQADDLRLTSTALAVSGSGVTTMTASSVTETSFSNVQNAIDTIKISQTTTAQTNGAISIPANSMVLFTTSLDATTTPSGTPLAITLTAPTDFTFVNTHTIDFEVGITLPTITIAASGVTFTWMGKTAPTSSLTASKKYQFVFVWRSATDLKAYYEKSI